MRDGRDRFGPAVNFFTFHLKDAILGQSCLKVWIIGTNDSLNHILRRKNQQCRHTWRRSLIVRDENIPPASFPAQSCD